MSVLDTRTARDLTIKADYRKNFSVTISGITTLDTNYILTLRSVQNVVTYQVGSGITITPGTPNVVTISFTGSDFMQTKYSGTFESVNKNADTFVELDITLELT